MQTFFLLQGTQDEALKTSVWEGACITISFQIQMKILCLLEAVPAELRFMMQLEGSHTMKPCSVRMNRILWFVFVFDLLARC